MQSLILTIYIIVCILLIILVLLQSGKEGMGVIFGGGNTSVFGSAGAGGILAKLTTLMAIVFVIMALAYTYVTSSKPAAESVILDVRIEDPVPAQPRQEATPPAAENPAKAPEAASPGADTTDPAGSAASAAEQKDTESAFQPAPEAKAPDAASPASGD